MPKAEYSDAIALLKDQHRQVEDLFDQYQKEKGEGRREKLARQICVQLKIHTMIEEEIFYPAFEGKIEDDILDEARVEHDAAKLLVNDIDAGSPGDEFFDAKVTVLCEEIRHHVHEEEMRGEGMFAHCRKTGVDLIDLRDRMLERTRELQQMAKSQGLPPAMPSAMNLATA